jgi:ferredoxin
MKPPAVNSKVIGIILAVVVGGFGFYWYYDPFPWLGAIVGIVTGLLTFFMLTSGRVERLRRPFFIGLFVIAIVSILAIISDMGFSTFMDWVARHEKEYFIPLAQTGTASYPCTREIPQVLLGRAYYLGGIRLWVTPFPSTLAQFGLLLIPVVATALIFGRGFCGWICPAGGLPELASTGKRQWWPFKALHKTETMPNGSTFQRLKEWMKDTKYGVLLGVILLSVILSFPLMCLLCPALWLTAIPIFWALVALVVIMAVILPIMTKRRWWCLFVCPLGTVMGLFNKINPFRLKIDKNKCTSCMECVQVCNMYAMTPEIVERGSSTDTNCIKCGRCIEACPEEAIDFYLVGTNIKARALFISLAVIAVIAWYTWVIMLLADIIRLL